MLGSQVCAVVLGTDAGTALCTPGKHTTNSATSPQLVWCSEDSSFCSANCLSLLNTVVKTTLRLDLRDFFPSDVAIGKIP